MLRSLVIIGVFTVGVAGCVQNIQQSKFYAKDGGANQRDDGNAPRLDSTLVSDANTGDAFFRIDGTHMDAHPLDVSTRDADLGPGDLMDAGMLERQDGTTTADAAMPQDAA